MIAECGKRLWMFDDEVHTRRSAYSGKYRCHPVWNEVKPLDRM